MASKVRVVLNHDKFMKQLADSIEVKLHRIGMLIVSTAVRKVNIGQKVRRAKSGRLVGLQPSKPGKPPRTLSGRFKQSITHVVERQVGTMRLKVGSNVSYARRLELGFVGRDKRGRNVSQAARPWLRVSVQQVWKKIGEIMRS